MSPPLTSDTATRNSCELRCMEPVWNTRPYLRAASINSFVSCTEYVSGFSQYTSLPCFIASTAMYACQWSGVAMHTMSMAGSLTISWKS